MQRDVKSSVVLMEDDILPICQFRMLFIDCCLVGLIGNSICPNLSSGCVEGVRNTRCPFNPIRYTAPSSDADRPLERLIVAYFVFPKIFSISHWCKQSIFHRPWLFVSKMDYFHCVWAKNRRWKCGPLNFFSSNCETPKHRNDLCTECFQMLYNTHMRYMEYLCDVSCRVTWIIFNQC